MKFIKKSEFHEDEHFSEINYFSEMKHLSEINYCVTDQILGISTIFVELKFLVTFQVSKFPK